MNSNTINNNNNTVALTAKEIQEKRAIWAINHDARLSELERGVRDAMLGRNNWELEVLPCDSNGRKLALVRDGEHLATFFGRYLSGDCLGRPGGYGVTWQSEFQQELKQNPIEGVVYEWEARGRGLGADMKHGIPYHTFKIEMTSQNISASDEEAATRFAELLVGFENRKFAQDMQWQVSRCYCWGKGTCDRCKHLREEAILQAG
jgi:hypothetical protein